MEWDGRGEKELVDGEKETERQIVVSEMLDISYLTGMYWCHLLRKCRARERERKKEYIGNARILAWKKKVKTWNF